MTRHQQPSKEFFDAVATPQASQDVARWRQDQSYCPPFEIVRWRVVDEEWEGHRAIDAVVVVKINGQEDSETAQGVGGVQALDSALRRVLLHHFPLIIRDVRLVELYTHRGGSGTAAEVVSIMKFSDGQQQWSTMRKSRDLLASAWMALVDGYEWAITTLLNEKNRKG